MPKYIRGVVSKVTIASLAGEITISQMVILNLLKTADKCKMNEIAKSLHVTTSAATGIVDRMVRGGYLKRVPGEKDRRIINIEMTQKGKKIIDDIDKRRYRFIVDIFSKFKPIERERFLATMKKIYGAISGERG